VRTLVLNAGYEPLAVVSFKRAIVLVLDGKASIIASDDEHPVLSASGEWERPSVILLRRYVRIPSGRAVPVSRRFTVRRFWCVLARHRVQRLCYEARLHTRSGRLPLILWTRPTKVGERSFLLCRAGICAEDFDAHIGELRAACYARDARVTRHPRWSQLVTIDIIRRDPLTAAAIIPSPLARLTAPQHPAPWPGIPEDHEAITT